MSQVYLDHNATTPLDDRVLREMLPYFTERSGNPSSRHAFGRNARSAIDEAREKVAKAVGAHASQVFFVSGGTEANNLAIKGVAAQLAKSQIAVSAIEHPCVLKPVQELGARGWKIRSIAVSSAGLLDLSDLDQALLKPTAMVSVMLANNETGAIQPVAQAAERARKHGAYMHTDAVQALGKIPLDFSALGIHMMTLSGHKIYGPKGIGALIIDKRLEVTPLLSGGSHEKGMRAGTENVPAIVGFGVACELATQDLAQRTDHLQSLRDRLEQGLAGMQARIFSEHAQRLPNTSFFAIAGIDGETLLMALDQAGFAVGSGSACSSGSSDASPILTAMGVPVEIARGAIRVSLGWKTKLIEIDEFLKALQAAVTRLKNLSAMVSAA